MSRPVPLLLMLCCACTPTFSGDRGLVTFETTLSHQFVGWGPSMPVALGSTFTVNVHEPLCLADCPPPRFFDGRVEGAAVTTSGVAEPPGSGRLTLTAAGEGSSVVTFTQTDGGVTDRFTVRVAPAASLGLSDPMLFNRTTYPEFLGFDGGTWPDVGTSLVIGPRGVIYLEVIVRADGGAAMGYDHLSTLLTADGGGGWYVAPAGKEIDLLAPDSGAASFEVAFGDAGVAQAFDVHVAGAEEASALELLVQPISVVQFVFKANALTTDGGIFLEPELEWQADPVFTEVALEQDGGGGLRGRRDVRLYDFAPRDAGTYDAGVTVRFGPLSASRRLSLTVLEAPPPPPPPPPPPAACSCDAGGGPMLAALVALALVARRRKQQCRTATGVARAQSTSSGRSL